MAILDLDPNSTGAARAYAELLSLLDRPGAVAAMDDKLTEIFGERTVYRIRAEADFPCTWGYAEARRKLLIFISGIRTARHFPQLAASYLDTRTSLADLEFVPAIEGWAKSLKAMIPANLVSGSTQVAIVGHSLGGAIAPILFTANTGFPAAIEKKSCTFGAPKFIARAWRPFNGMAMARWTNPEDNVPSLPPLSGQAPQLYGFLTRTQRVYLEAWRQPCQALSVNSTGGVTRIDDPPSKNITLTTLLQALQSRDGAFGPGHDLSVYIQNLTRARQTYVEQAVPGVRDAGPGTIAPPPVPVQAITPRVIPAPVPEPVLRQRITVFRELAIANDSASVNLPFPNQMRTVRENGTYYVKWMSYYIATAPTKKKARACCRHMNRFLRIFQGVGQCSSPDFVYALSDYLTDAANSDTGYRPLLNDGGNPPWVVFM